VNNEAAALHADPERAFDGQYQLGAEIGAGALGIVYRGVDERLDKPVAIKVWHARFDETAPMREQYDAEARALTALEHPNLVAITDYGIAGQAPYLIMELLEGQTLEARMRASALPVSMTQTFMESVLRGLGYMHMRGVVHRNLKPDNVFLQTSEDNEAQTLKLLDLSVECLPANGNAAGAATISLAQRSPYDSPEQEAGSEPDGRSDVYAAGVLMTHMLSGHEPARDAMREAGDSADALSQLLPHATPEALAFIGRAVATERSARFGNADQMLRALLEVPTPWSTRVEEVAAPRPRSAMPVTSVRPASQPAHVDFAGSATSAFHEQTAEPPTAASDDSDLEVAPIGLMARLRARKRLLSIIGGGLLLIALTASATLWLEHNGPNSAAMGGEEAYAAAESDAAKDAAKPKTPEPAAEAEQAQNEAEAEEPEPEAEGKAAQAKAEEPAAAVAAPPPEAFKSSARLGGDEVERKPATSDKLILPEPEVAQPADQHAADEQPAAQPQAQAAAASGEANAPPSDQEIAKTDHEASEKSAAPTPAAAEGVHAAANPAAAAAAPASEKPKPLTPQEIGSVRHTEPDRTEIRQMLVLAVAPKPRVAAKNPWNIAVPDLLQAMRDAIAHGERGSPGNIKTLRRYNAANLDDVYGHLLLAGFYANRGYSLDALDQYDLAYRIDSSSRGAPEMLKHALGMVSQGSAVADATRFIDRVYGREAQAAIAQLLRARDTDVAAARRLKLLQARIGSGKRR
jgi:serine/threonine-protein kinase